MSPEELAAAPMVAGAPKGAKWALDKAGNKVIAYKDAKGESQIWTKPKGEPAAKAGAVSTLPGGGGTPEDARREALKSEISALQKSPTGLRAGAAERAASTERLAALEGELAAIEQGMVSPEEEAAASTAARAPIRADLRARDTGQPAARPGLRRPTRRSRVSGPSSGPASPSPRPSSRWRGR